ncbi:MAG: hypothetical protein ABJL99_16465 [Aliishimia sp.]
MSKLVTLLTNIDSFTVDVPTFKPRDPSEASDLSIYDGENLAIVLWLTVGLWVLLQIVDLVLLDGNAIGWFVALLPGAAIGIISQYARKRAEIDEYNRITPDSLKNGAAGTSRGAKSAMKRAVAVNNKMQRTLSASEAHSTHAKQFYKQNNFGRFWDEIENSVKTLGEYAKNLDEMKKARSDYETELRTRQHNFPAFPSERDAWAKPDSALRELNEAKHLGETNYQFAAIWE